jgi:16S rRNA (guanine966-N2)-methyltransferase
MAQPRIIAGTARGIRIESVPGDTTRPITDRVKESLFNIIGSDIIDSTFLDLFGGTGSVGIEAISRGAKHCIFVESAPHAIKTIRKNLEATKLSNRAAIHQMDSFQFLRNPPGSEFDYVYIAPPQYKGMWIKALELVNSIPRIVSADGWVIAQIDPVEMVDVNFEHLIEFDRRKYGSTLLLFYSKPQITN